MELSCAATFYTVSEFHLCTCIFMSFYVKTISCENPVKIFLCKIHVRSTCLYLKSSCWNQFFYVIYMYQYTSQWISSFLGLSLYVKDIQVGIDVKNLIIIVLLCINQMVCHWVYNCWIFDNFMLIYLYD